MKVFNLAKMRTLGSVRDGAFQFTPEGFARFFGAIQHHFNQPFEQLRAVRKRIKELATEGQFPEQVAQLFEQFKVGRGEVDLSWMNVFDTVDLNNTSASSYAITDIQNGVSFKIVRPGEKPLVYGLTGTETSVGFDQYGAGLQIPGVWYEDQRWWDIEESVQDYNLAWWEDLATVMFALIEAATDGIFGGTVDGVNIAYDTTGSDQLEKDVNTINTAVISLLENLKAAGMRVNPATPLVLMCNINREDRCAAALDAKRGITYDGAEIRQSIRLVSTLNLTKTNTWNSNSAGTEHTADCLPLGYLCVPGRKCKYINRKSLQVYPPVFNPEIYATSVFAWGRYGGVLNEAQIRRLLPVAGA